LLFTSLATLPDAGRAAVARAFHARCTAPSVVRHRRTRASRVGAPRTDHPRRPPPARPVTHRPVSTTRLRLVTARAASTPPAHPDDDSPSTSGRIDDASVRFDLDPALAAWITARFLFIWISLGYLPVPILAMLEGVDDAAALRTSHLALALVASECGKLGGTTTMLNAELGASVDARNLADPRHGWTRYFLDEKVQWASVAEDVKRGVAFGLVASVAARLVDAIVNGGSDAADGPAGGALALLAYGQTDGHAGLATVALITSSCVLAPATEELFFRGFVLPACDRVVGNVAVSIAATAGLFAAVHFSPRDAASLLAAGCAFGAAAVDWDSSSKKMNASDASDANATMGFTAAGLAAPTAAHATFNAGVLLEAVLRG
jgi:membrane protease YdiL (CAAX protease family)